MIKRKILIISNYPIVQPRDGGQMRVNAIVGEYRQHFGEVRSVAVFRGNYAKYQKGDIFVSTNGDWPAHLVPFIGDVIASEAIFNHPKTRQKMTKLLKTFQPDIIQIEQAFPYMGLKPLLQSLNLRPKIVLSSHNIEYLHKQEILEGLGVTADQAEPIVQKIKGTEEEICRDAELVIAVSESDAEVHRQMGAKKCVIAPNGIAKVIASPNAKNYWQRFFANRLVEHKAAFIGSAHPPNWNGFLTMVGRRVGFMPPDSRLLLAGSIADYFKEHIIGGSPADATFWLRVMPIGRLSEDRLAGLIDNLDVIILPITEGGGGSNLKTAEAILSGKKVVATSYAFRSFERYQHLPNIFIADKPAEFRRMIVKAMSEPVKPRTAAEQRLAGEVQWHYCLKPAIGAVTKL